MGYIHRDLKPDNFLVGADGHVKLTDFGLSKDGATDYRTGQTASGRRILPVRSPVGSVSPSERSNTAFSVVGSPNYMAPEVLDIGPDGYGAEVDWWSLGCIFFEMITGYPPFSGSTPEEVFDNVRNWRHVLPEMIEYNRHMISEEFIDLILHLIADPQHRWGDDQIEGIQRHPFFATIGSDWTCLRTLHPGFTPHLSGDMDTSYFDAPCSPGSPTARSSPTLRLHRSKTATALKIQAVDWEPARPVDTPKRTRSAANIGAVTQSPENGTSYLDLQFGPLERQDKENSVSARQSAHAFVTPKSVSKRHSTQLPPLVSPQPFALPTPGSARSYKAPPLQFQPVPSDSTMGTRSQAKRERRRSIQTASATKSRLVRVGLAPIGSGEAASFGVTPPDETHQPFRTPTKTAAVDTVKEHIFVAPTTTGRRPLPRDQSSPAREILGFTFRRSKMNRALTDICDAELAGPTKLDFGTGTVPDSFVRSASSAAVVETKSSSRKQPKRL